jgi:DNA-directed RNA polymerase subunit RPC12/RpoP
VLVLRGGHLSEAIVDLGQEDANMFGCTPCPKCGSEYRWPEIDALLNCDNCGFREPYRVRASAEEAT